MDTFDALQKRYSCRRYAPRPVPDELLKKLMQAAEWAPTAHNDQPYRIYTLDSPAALAKIKPSRRGFFDEPCVLLFTYKKDESWKRWWLDGFDAGTIDTTIALTQVCLAATSLGLESCIILAFDPELVRSAFAIPDDEEIIFQLSLGFPAADAKPSPRHWERRSVPLQRLE